MRAADLNLISHFRAELGVGEAARRLDVLLTASGFNLNRVNLNLSRSRQGRALANESRFEPKLPTITFANPDQLGAIVVNNKMDWNSQPHVGYWAWELETAPKVFRRAASLLDEIWTLSSFSRDSLQSIAQYEVKYLRLPVPIPHAPISLTRKEFGLSEKEFLALASFDFFSDSRRKGPDFAIEAFISAFPTPKNARLLIKTINGDKSLGQLEALRSKVADRPDITIWDGYLDHERNQALIELSDVFISLHRAEGYGLNLADAMARKTAVLATGYSGNLDFMDEESTELIPFSLVPVESYAGIKVNSRWAEPDVDFASNSLKKMYLDQVFTKEKAMSGFNKIRLEHSLEATVARFQKEFNLCLATKS